MISMISDNRNNEMIKDNERMLSLSLSLSLFVIAINIRNFSKLLENCSGKRIAYDIMFTILKQILFTDSFAQSLIRFTVIVRIRVNSTKRVLAPPQSRGNYSFGALCV